MIDLFHAAIIVDAALVHGRGLGLPPLTVAVLDSSGCLVCFKREDGSSLLRPEIAQAKAWGALGMGVGSRALAQRAAVAPAFVSAVNTLAGGRLIPVPGGVLIRDNAAPSSERWESRARTRTKMRPVQPQASGRRDSRPIPEN